MHRTLHVGIDMLLRFEMRVAHRQIVLKIDAKFLIFLNP